MCGHMCLYGRFEVWEIRFCSRAPTRCWWTHLILQWYNCSMGWHTTEGVSMTVGLSWGACRVCRGCLPASKHHCWRCVILVVSVCRWRVVHWHWMVFLISYCWYFVLFEFGLFHSLTHIWAAGAVALAAIVCVVFSVTKLWLWLVLMMDLVLNFLFLLNNWFLGWLWFFLKLRSLRWEWLLWNPVGLQ